MITWPFPTLLMFWKQCCDMSTPRLYKCFWHIKGTVHYVNRIVLSISCCFDVILWPTWHSPSSNHFLLKSDFNTLHFILPHLPITFCVRKEIKSGYSCLYLQNRTLVRQTAFIFKNCIIKSRVYDHDCSCPVTDGRVIRAGRLSDMKCAVMI